MMEFFDEWIEEWFDEGCPSWTWPLAIGGPMVLAAIIIPLVLGS